MPLMRVAHPSEQECQKELSRLKNNLPKSGTEKISDKGVPDRVGQKNPMLFDFDHNYDTALTPRRGWQQKVIALETKLDNLNSKLLQEVQLSATQKKENDQNMLKVEAARQEALTLQQKAENQLNNELLVKEQLQKHIERARFDNTQLHQRHQEELQNLKERLRQQEQEVVSYRNQLKECQQEVNKLKDENVRLRNSNANKDTQLQTYETLQDREKERRIATTEELRAQVQREQDRAILAVREAEQNAAKQDSMLHQVQRLEKELHKKDQKIEELQKQNQKQIGAQLQTEKEIHQTLERERKLQQAELDDKSSQLEVRLNRREADLQQMEQNLLQMHKKMDDLSNERRDAQIEAKQAFKLQVEAEKRLEALIAESRVLQQQNDRNQKKADDKAHQAEVRLYKTQLTLQALEKRVQIQDEEIERLRKVNLLGGVGESVTRLPSACVENLNSAQIKEIKEDSLHQALIDLKSADKSRDDLLHKIEDLENRQKRAYLKLYERVANEVGSSMNKSVEQHFKEIDQKVEEDKKKNANELEFDRLEQMKAMGYSKQAPAQQTLEDLFRKYNV